MSPPQQDLDFLVEETFRLVSPVQPSPATGPIGHGLLIHPEIDQHGLKIHLKRLDQVPLTSSCYRCDSQEQARFLQDFYHGRRFYFCELSHLNLSDRGVSWWGMIKGKELQLFHKVSSIKSVWLDQAICLGPLQLLPQAKQELDHFITERGFAAPAWGRGARIPLPALSMKDLACLRQVYFGEATDLEQDIMSSFPKSAALCGLWRFLRNNYFPKSR